MLLLSPGFSIGCRRLSSSLAAYAHAGLVFNAPGLDLTVRQGQDHSPIVEGVGVVAARLAKAAVAEDGKLLLLRPALALCRRAAEQGFQFPGGHSQFKGKDLEKLRSGDAVGLQARQEVLHEIGLDLP